MFWSYKPTQEKPESIPFFNSPDYETSFLEVEMSCSLQDSAYNTMDLLHPEFVHNNLDVENDRLRALLIALDIPHDLEDSNDVEQTEIDSGSN